jgi:hypothetical protein
MINKSMRILVATASAIGLLSGCSTTSSPDGIMENVKQTGVQPNGIAPQRVYMAPDFKYQRWLNVGSFQAVPEKVADAGLAYCNPMGTENAQDKAVGYHPYARDTAGNPIKGGGFICQSELDK